MTRRLVAAVLAGVLASTGVAGCGIPEFSEVTVDGEGTVGQAGSVDGRGEQPPARNASGGNREIFVRDFLSAAAGEPNEAYARVKQFIAPDERDKLQEKQGSDFAVNVVRLRDTEITQEGQDERGRVIYTVLLTVQQVGQLRANGVLAPPVATESQYSFQLRFAAGPEADDGAIEAAGYYVHSAPGALLLSDTALQDYYQPHPVYFWNSDQTRLVPDQRYLPLAVPPERRVTEVVGWLIDGPSEWLSPGVARLPDGTQRINNATETDGRWEVDIAMPDENDAKLDRLVTQLAWSLPEIDGHLELKIRNQTRRVVASLAAHRDIHPIYQVREKPQRFCVADGAIRLLKFVGEPVGTVPIDPTANRNVVSAALSRAGDNLLAALVVRDGKRQHLAVKVGRAPVSEFAHSTRDFAAMSRPTWLKGGSVEGARGLLVADGKLFRFDGGARLSEVPLAVPGAVTAVAAALDGQRIAMIVGGRLHVAAVNRDSGGVSIGPPRAVPTSLTDLSAVEWSGENQLYLAGTMRQQAIFQIGVDGAEPEIAFREDVGAKVTHLATYPANTVVSLGASAVMYEANGVAWSGSPPVQIFREQVQEAGGESSAARSGNPTAPFFLF